MSANQVIPPRADASGSGARRWRGALLNLIAMGPFATTLVVFKAMLDQLPADWFRTPLLKVLFAGLCALCTGLSIRLGGQALAARYADTVNSSAESEVGRAAHDVLRDTVKHVVPLYRDDIHQGHRLAGWSQYLDDRVPPTAVGTSYGLRLMLLLDVRDPRVNRHDIITTLLSLQRPGGGWAASTQRERARPEVTAWVLSAAVRSGLSGESREGLVTALERMLDTEADPIGMQRTTVLSVVVSVLAETAPGSPRLLELTQRLLEGARHVEREGTSFLCWGEGLHSTTPSVPHTARAALALGHAAAVLGESDSLDNAAESAVAWLCSEGDDLRMADEQLRRPVTDGSVDALFIGHFTAAWKARAIMSRPSISGRRAELRAVVEEVLKCQQNGVWSWHDGSRPIWMTYQGAKVLRDYALRTSR